MEFIAKVNAILRRGLPRKDTNVSYFLNDKLSINYATHEVRLSGKPVKLTPIEYKILCQLAKKEGSIVSHAILLHSVWGSGYGDKIEFLKNYIYRLRSKVEEDLSNPEIILTERGVGYIFIASSASTQYRPLSTR